MTKPILFSATLFVFVSACTNQENIRKREIKVSRTMINPPETGRRPGNSYVVKTTSIPSDITVLTSTTNTEKTIDAGMQLVLKKLNLPNRKMAGWPGKIAFEEEGILNKDSHKRNQSYETLVGEQNVIVNLSIVSIHFALDAVDSSQRNKPLVISVNNSEKHYYLKLINPLHQADDRYSQTVQMGVKISTKLENGTTADQIVYIMAVVGLTFEEFKQFKYSF